MTVKNGLEQFILKFLHVHKSEDFAQKFKFSSKNDVLDLDGPKVSKKSPLRQNGL